MKTKKLLAVLLSLVMALSLLPVSAALGDSKSPANNEGPGTLDPGKVTPGTLDPNINLIPVESTTVPYLNGDGEWIENQLAGKITSSINFLGRRMVRRN